MAVRAEAMVRAVQRRRSVALERSMELVPNGEGRLLCVCENPYGWVLAGRERTINVIVPIARLVRIGCSVVCEACRPLD